MNSVPDIPADTRHRLLQAAGEIFAEHGYRQTTVRDIIERAGVNIAAVNYHFRDKLGLYLAVLQHWLGAALDKYPPDGGVAPTAPAEVRLAAFVRAFLFRLLDGGTPAWHGRLLAREMADPTPGVIEMLVATHMRPHGAILFAVVSELLGPAATEETVRFCAFSTVGQCLFYRHCEATIRLMAPEQKYAPEDVERIARHITRMALGGMASYRRDAVVRARVKRGKGRKISEHA